MTPKELIDKLDPNTRENLWDIIIDGNEYFEDENTPTLNSEVKKWSLEYGLVDHFFRLTLRIYTIDYVPYFFEETEEYENNIDTDFQDTLLSMKDNKKKVETVNQKLSEYMKTLKDFYGKISIKTLKENYDDSFEISFYTNEIDDNIISTLEKYKDYEVYDVRCEQYCSYPPVDCRVIYLDNRRKKSW